MVAIVIVPIVCSWVFSIAFGVPAVVIGQTHNYSTQCEADTAMRFSKWLTISGSLALGISVIVTCCWILAYLFELSVIAIVPTGLIVLYYIGWGIFSAMNMAYAYNCFLQDTPLWMTGLAVTIYYWIFFFAHIAAFIVAFFINDA